MGSTPARRIYAAWLAGALRRGGYGLYFEPNNVPLAFGPRTVVTLHDLSVHEHPQWHTPGRVGQWRRRLAQSLERTDHWITPSAFTRDRLIRLLDVRPECISVIPLAGRNLPDPSQSPAQGLADAVPQSCFLHVGTIEPRKNLPALLDAWLCTGADFRRRNRLVLAGGCGWGPRHLWHRLAEHPVSSEVLACGYVSEAQLAYLLAHARALVLPSTYEGFGLPIVEAARFATPVICSTAPVFAEVAGDAAERIDPTNSEAWAQAMRRMAEDAAWREQCGRRISRVSEAYNWRVTAEAHAALFRRLLTRPG
jgi:alpha-1,3-rhamnosyl/mannosyltransferase